MRQIVLDTETTGLDVHEGHRVIEIAGIEIDNRVPTGKTFHQFINPCRPIDDKALEVHGITNDFLENKPQFAEIAHEFVNFIRGADLIIHNAEFDVGFLNAELKKAGNELGSIETLCNEIIDTIRVAIELRPGRRNNLDALATDYGIDLSERTKHSALVDAQILLSVYKAMTGGQTSMQFSQGEISMTRQTDSSKVDEEYAGAELPVKRANDEELALHEQWLDYLDSQCEQGSVWRRLQQASADDYDGGNPKAKPDALSSSDSDEHQDQQAS